MLGVTSQGLSQTRLDLTSTLKMLSDEYEEGIADNTITTDEYARLAYADLRTFTLVLETHRIIPQTPIDAHKVLHSMLEHAPTEHGRRYTACAILSCHQSTMYLTGLAGDWLKFLLWPCMLQAMLFHRTSFLFSNCYPSQKRSPGANSSIL